MDKREFQRVGAIASRFAKEPVVVDCEDENILGIEIIGYSSISGRLPESADFQWLSQEVVSVGCDREEDVLTVEVAHGINTGQKSVDAVFGFDDDGRLVSLALPAE